MLAKPRGDPAAVLKQGRELSPIRQLYANLYAQLYVGARFRALPNAGASEVFQRRSWIVSDLPDNAELGMLSRHRAVVARAGWGRNAAGAIREAGGNFSHARVCAARAALQFEPR